MDILAGLCRAFIKYRLHEANGEAVFAATDFGKTWGVAIKRYSDHLTGDAGIE